MVHPTRGVPVRFNAGPEESHDRPGYEEFQWINLLGYSSHVSSSLPVVDYEIIASSRQ
jgi:hypothetical protein